MRRFILLLMAWGLMAVPVLAEEPTLPDAPPPLPGPQQSEMTQEALPASGLKVPPVPLPEEIERTEHAAMNHPGSTAQEHPSTEGTGTAKPAFPPVPTLPASRQLVGNSPTAATTAQPRGKVRPSEDLKVVDKPVEPKILPPQNPVLPEIVNQVVLSNTDVNRIACPGPVQDLIYSTEKQVEASYWEKDVFIKFKKAKRGTDVLYAADPTEFFIRCEDTVYNIVATPQQVSAVTLRLASPRRQQIESNVSAFAGMGLEEKILKLIKQAYRGEIPEDYTQEKRNDFVNLSQDLIVTKKLVIKVEGEGLILTEYQARSNRYDTRTGTGLQAKNSEEELRLRETDFLRPSMGKRILAVSVVDHVLKRGDTTRVFVVSQAGGEL